MDRIQVLNSLANGTIRRMAHRIGMRSAVMQTTCIALTLLAIDVPRSLAQNPLATLRPGHPRLIMLDSDLPDIKANIANEPFAAATFAELVKEGDKLLTKPVNTYNVGGAEKNLLATARDVEDVVVTLCFLYRVTGHRNYADRAIQEMYAAAAFPDWYPTHFLDTAELTAALGIGYDWLYPILTPKQRGAIHAAIVIRGLEPWLEITGGAPNPKGLKQFNMMNNWMQVCVGGETLGALAVADEEPDRARYILANSQNQIKSVMHFFEPDGGFDEGPVYWSYATTYNMLYLAALDSALGTDFGLSRMPGFSETGNYRIQAIGPSYKTANFGDAHDTIFRSPQMFWMAVKFHKPEYAIAERRIDEAFPNIPGHNAKESERFLAFTLVYYRPPPAGIADPPDVARFQRSNQAFLRNDWSHADGKADTNAFYVALKGGKAKSNHGHLDMGSFVLDALGERWAIDLGPDSYGLTRYNNIDGPDRWTYFRTSTEGHNTLTVGSKNESLDSDAHLIAVGESASGTEKYAVMDLDSAYKDKLKHWKRGVKILPGPSIVIQDEFVPNGETDIVWRMLTEADIHIESNPAEATLTLHNKKLHLKLLSPANAHFERFVPPAPASPQESNGGMTELVIHLSSVSQPANLSIFVSGSEDSAPAADVLPLAQWSGGPQ